MKRISVAGLAGCIAGCAAIAWVGAPSRLQADQSSFSQIQLGKKLVAAGDCEGCHTREGGPIFGGGRPLNTPFGTIYTPNITPDAETGIGSWTDDQFYRALHEGIAADGSHLYPAFPYPWFTKVTRADVEAIHAYLKTVPVTSYRSPPNTLPWPVDDRESMRGWNALYFRSGIYVPDPKHDAIWNRGAYLVLGLGHCGACHTPTNTLGAAESDRHLQGGVLSNWYAPSLVGDARGGLSDWNEQAIVSFLKTGGTPNAVAFGPMSEVVHYSTSAMSDDDLKAIAVYLKSLPATKDHETPNRPAAGVAEAGQAIYVDTCSACHGENGQGVPAMFPPLKGSAIVQGADPTTVVRLILNGGHAVATDQRPTGVSMPSFGWKLSDKEVAAVASFVCSAWGNEGSPVSASEVQSVRKSVKDVSSAD
jgi:mono/diheme cytochrome c family protein